MRRKALTILFTALLIALPLAASAGGWAAVSMDSVPGEFEAGETYSLDFTVLAHGHTPVDWGELTAAFQSADGQEIAFSAHSVGKGRYTVDVLLPEGDWSWAIVSGDWSLQEMGDVAVVDSTGASPRPAVRDYSALKVLFPVAALTVSIWTVTQLMAMRRPAEL